MASEMDGATRKLGEDLRRWRSPQPKKGMETASATAVAEIKTAVAEIKIAVHDRRAEIELGKSRMPLT